MNQKLYKSSNKVFAGVLGGVADYFSWEVTWVRLIYTAFTLFTGFFPGAFLYLVAVVIIPNRPNRRDIDADESN